MSRRATWAGALAASLAAAALASCGGSEPAPQPAPALEEATGPTRTESGSAVGAGRGGVALERIGTFDQPVYVTEPPEGGDLYVVEKTGRVRVVRAGRTLEQPFLDLGDEVSSSGEQGLLSIAFAPDFARSRLLYAFYTDLAGDERVIELRAATPERVDPDSRRDVLHVEDFASNHNGGLLMFGPDGLLYVGLGDGGGAGDPERNALDLSSPLGKILRIDPRPSGGRPYTVPEDNPFVGEAGAAPEVYSYGLRNPWRFSFDRETGALSIGDVGQDSFEEVDYVLRGEGRGAGFGWSALEGNEPFNSDQSAPDQIPPILVYGRDRGCSVTGGYVVRDPALTSLQGRYLYGDFCQGELRSFVPRVSGAEDDRALGLDVTALSSFGEDARGRVYAVSLDGPVYRLVPP